MIQATIIAMTVLGCGEQSINCEPIIGPNKTWESIAECDAEIPNTLRASTDAPYPVIMASCYTVTDDPIPDAQIALAKSVNEHPAETMNGVSFYDVPSNTESSEMKDEDEQKSNIILSHVKEGYALIEETANSGLQKLNGLKKRLTPSKKLSVLLKE